MEKKNTIIKRRIPMERKIIRNTVTMADHAPTAQNLGSNSKELRAFPVFKNVSAVILYPENCPKSPEGQQFAAILDEILDGAFVSPEKTGAEISFLSSLTQLQQARKEAITPDEIEAIRRIEDTIVFRLRSVNQPIRINETRRNSNFAVGYLCGNKVIKKDYLTIPRPVPSSNIGSIYCALLDKAMRNR
jgi:hypothetical protein